MGENLEYHEYSEEKVSLCFLDKIGPLMFKMYTNQRIDFVMRAFVAQRVRIFSSAN